MKRSTILQPFSREHHHALVLAKACERAASSGDAPTIEASCTKVLQAFGDELEAHFQTEERLVLPSLQPDQQALLQRTESDHVQLRALQARIRQNDPSALSEFGQLLAAHVRFEERELFPAYEQTLSGR